MSAAGCGALHANRRRVLRRVLHKTVPMAPLRSSLFRQAFVPGLILAMVQAVMATLWNAHRKQCQYAEHRMLCAGALRNNTKLTFFAKRALPGGPAEALADGLSDSVE